jgi:hypothetical protein
LPRFNTWHLHAMLVHLPPQRAISDSGSMAHVRQHASSVPDSKYMPALAMAACATCQLARHAATKRGSFLTIFFCRWSFLTIRWQRRSFSSKIHSHSLTGSWA